MYGFGDQYVAFCEPCGHESAVAADVLAVEIRATGSEGYWEVLVNHQPIDLAYSFVQDREDGGYTNLSKLVGCTSDRVSTCLDAELQPQQDCTGGADPYGAADAVGGGTAAAADATGCSAASGAARGDALLMALTLALGLMVARRRARS